MIVHEAQTLETTYLDHQGWEGIISFSASDQELSALHLEHLAAPSHPSHHLSQLQSS